MKYLFTGLLVLYFATAFSQDLQSKFSYDTFKLKKIIYLHIFLDQVISEAMVARNTNLKLNDSMLNSLRIKDIKSNGLPEELLFGEARIFYPNFRAEVVYLFCYNASSNQFYTLAGFADNQFNYLFEYLNLTGIKVSKEFFNRKNIKVPGLDFNCLIDIYLSLKKRKIKGIGFGTRYKYPCLNFNFQSPIIN